MKRKFVIIIVVAILAAVGIFAAVIIQQEQAQKQATLNAFFNDDGKPIGEIADEFQAKYGE